MPGKKSTQAERTRALKALAEGLNQNEVARLLNRSPAWVSELIRTPEGRKIKQRQAIPDPLEYHQLSAPAREAFDSFNAFRRRYFAREEVAWAELTAQQLVAALADPAKSYLALAAPSGAGKTTLDLDLACWALIRNRALRVMLASETLARAKDLLRWVKARFEATTPFYDHDAHAYAEGVLQFDYGRLVPQSASGDPVLWREDQVIIPQIGDMDLSSKEPSIQLGSRDATIQGARIDLLIMDDIVSARTYKDPALSSWWSREVERRIEPGGALLLVGSRVGPEDLFEEVANKQYEDDSGTIRKKYITITYPAHREPCDGIHRQWDGNDDGCLLDAKRVPWSDILAHRDDRNFSTSFQQSPEGDRGGLVPKLWVVGGEEDDETFPGCLDVDRALGEFPTVGPDPVWYATVDPALSGMWAIQVWLTTKGTDARRYLVHAVRREIRLDEFVRIDPASGSLVGILMDLQRTFPIKVWVIEGNFGKGLTQSTAFGFFDKLYGTTVLWPRTGSDRNASIQSLLPALFRAGLIRIPYRDEASRTLARQLISELAAFPHGRTADLVIATWLGEKERRNILSRVAHPRGQGMESYVGGMLRHHGHPSASSPTVTPDPEWHTRRGHTLVPCQASGGCGHAHWCLEDQAWTSCAVTCDCPGENIGQPEAAAGRPRIMYGTVLSEERQRQMPILPFGELVPGLTVDEQVAEARARARALATNENNVVARAALGLPPTGRPDGTRP